MKISSLKDLHKFTNKISEIILPGDYLFLFGEIGVGKTTFARQLINVFELKNNIKKSEVPSPTFNILFEYELKDFIIKHYDLYRLKNEEEIKNLELFEIEEKNITLIEWPELIKNKPTNRIDLFFKYTKNMKQRVLNIKLAGRLKKYDFKV
jgi:tRNA threonylcarbamoyladenosine biosynthesis protein TsaE|tara:strand:+ start:1099 stop:1551 length:453 start_codon:yes stop_codon:yes gene_type:complete